VGEKKKIYIKNCETEIEKEVKNKCKNPNQETKFKTPMHGNSLKTFML
jgi:hypothetical protein